MLEQSEISNVAVVFYREGSRLVARVLHRTLGLEFEVKDTSSGYLLARLPGNVELLFFEGDAKPGASPQFVFGLAQGGIASVAEALAARGVQVVTPVSEAPGGWSFNFADPDGHLLSLYQDGALPQRI